MRKSIWIKLLDKIWYGEPRTGWRRSRDLVSVSHFLTEHGPQKKRQGMKVEDRPGACKLCIYRDPQTRIIPHWYVLNRWFGTSGFDEKENSFQCSSRDWLRHHSWSLGGWKELNIYTLSFHNRSIIYQIPRNCLVHITFITSSILPSWYTWYVCENRWVILAATFVTPTWTHLVSLCWPLLSISGIPSLKQIRTGCWIFLDMYIMLESGINLLNDDEDNLFPKMWRS